MRAIRNVRAVLVSVLAAMALVACRQEDRQSKNDWDATQEVMVANALSNCNVSSIVEDAKGFIWVGTFRGLNRFDGQEYHQYFCTDDSTGLCDNQVKALLADSRKRLWVGTVNGICRYTEQDNFVRIPVKTDNKNFIKLSEDRQGRVFAYNRDGALLYDEESGEFAPIGASHSGTAPVEEQSPAGKGDTLEDHVTATLQDSRGNLWIGTSDRGLTVRYSGKERFNGDQRLNEAVGHTPVTDVACDRQGNLWIASQDKGILLHDASGHTRQVAISGEDPRKNVAVHLLADADGCLWTASGAGVLKCKYDGGERLTPVARFDVPGTMCMAQAADKTVWLSTSDGKVFRVKWGSDRAEKKQLFDSDSFIPSVTSLRDGSLLVAACRQKMTLLNPATMKAAGLPVPAADWKTCIKRSVFVPVDICQDRHGNLWIGTVANGLARIDGKTRRMEHIYGLSCSDISSIEEDAEGNLWISTLKGLNKCDPKARRVTMFYQFDGMGGDEFCDRASCRMPDGRLVFGGMHGLTYFKPSDINVKRNVPLYFQDLKVHGIPVRPDSSGIIARSLAYCPDVNLRYDQNSFSISFCALDYRKNPCVHYFYKMDGVDDDWVDAGTARSGSYANLPSGDYTFHVKVVDSGNLTTLKEASLKVTVMPAPWNTPWAWLLYLILLGMLGTYLYGNTMRTMTARQAAREAEREKEQELRTNQMNMSFFANIAHEFRTPLTMIAGPVGQLAGSRNIDGGERKLLAVAQRSIQRMFRLVNQLMDFNKLESDTLRLNVEPVDVVKAVGDICDTFEFNAREKGLTLCRQGMEETLAAWTDKDKLEKIVSNLLSNALKFTPRGGRIDIMLDAHGGQVEIRVADTGKGIPEDQLENVFKRYYQLDNQTKGFVNWGTGIGLYFSRRLAELHRGSLKANNRQEGTGAVFTLTYPMEEAAYTEEERRPLQEDETFIRPVEKAGDGEGRETAAASEQEDNRPAILVVDDDVEIVNYMRLLFSHDYRLVTCLDARSALEQMRLEEPNLVLSDVSMPGMSGYELCKEIKQDIQLCHIPVILVTAKVTVDNQVEGLGVGADAYVTKPFEPAVLKALIQSQLKNRERIRSILTNSTTAEVEEVDHALSDQDKRFMNELYKLMEEELGNPELDVMKMTQLLYISRTKLYYKIKGLTGETPANFFRTYKLNRAAELVKEGRFTLSEIAVRCGFSSQSHFSIVFKKQFGVAPSAFKGKKVKK